MKIFREDKLLWEEFKRLVKCKWIINMVSKIYMWWIVTFHSNYW